MTITDIIMAMLAGLGLAFIGFLIIRAAGAVSEWKYQREREKQYADEWVRRHRAEGVSSFPDHRRQGGE